MPAVVAVAALSLLEIYVCYFIEPPLCVTLFNDEVFCDNENLPSRIFTISVVEHLTQFVGFYLMLNHLSYNHFKNVHDICCFYLLWLLEVIAKYENFQN